MKFSAAKPFIVFCYRPLSPLLASCTIWPRTQINSRNYLKKYNDMYLTRISQWRQTFWMNWSTWRRASRNPWGTFKIQYNAL